MTSYDQIEYDRSRERQEWHNMGRRLSLIVFLVFSTLALGWIPIFDVIEQNPIGITLWCIVWVLMLGMAALGLTGVGNRRTCDDS